MEEIAKTGAQAGIFLERSPILGIERIMEFLQCADLKEETIRSYRKGLKLYVEHLINNRVGDLKLCNVTHVMMYKEMVSKMKVATNTKSQYIQGVRSYYEWEGINGGANLSRNIKKFSSVKTYSKDAISELEWKKALACINRTSYYGQRDFTILYILFCTGMRQMSLQHLKWSDIVSWGASDDGKVRLAFRYKRKCRGEDYGLVPIAKNLVVVMNDWNIRTRERQGRVEMDWHIFGEESGITVTRVRDIVRDRLKEAGVYVAGSKTPHSLRHGLAVHLIESGMSLQDVANMLGHESVNSTKFYSHKKEKLQSMNNVSDVLDRLME